MFLTLLFITLISAVGIILTLKNKIPHILLSILIALGAGSMLTVSLLHILPESVEHSPYWALAFLLGFVIIYIFEEIFSPHSHDHKHYDHTHEDPHEHSHHIAIVAFLAIFVHTLFDGMAIRAGMEISEVLSYAIIFGVAIHQIPVSLSLSAIFKKSHLSQKMQIILMIFFALAVWIGFLISDFALQFFGNDFATLATAVAGGSLLYIASVDLLPMTHSENTKKFFTISAFLTGIILMSAFQIFGKDFHTHNHEHEHHHEMHEHDENNEHDEH